MTLHDPRLDTRHTPVPDPAAPDPAPRPRRRLDLSVTQLIASALAAITATVAASYLGVAGTVIGAAVASVLTVIGKEVYGHSLQRTGDRVREAVPVAARLAPRVAGDRAPYDVSNATLPTARPLGPDEQPPALPGDGWSAVRRSPARPPWRRIAVGVVGVFVTVLAVVTGVEVVAGRPLSDVVRGDSGTGTSVFGGVAPDHGGTSGSTTHPAGRSGTPTVTRTVTPSVVETTPTVTRTAPARTKTTTPTTTPTTRPSTSAGSSSGTTGPTGASSQSSSAQQPG